MVFLHRYVKILGLITNSQNLSNGNHHLMLSKEFNKLNAANRHTLIIFILLPSSINDA